MAGETRKCFHGSGKACPTSKDHRRPAKQIISNGQRKGGTRSSFRKTPYIALNVLERLERLRRRLDSPPKKTFFQNDANWRNAWNGFKEGFDIAYSHFDSLLMKEGISRIETTGKPFDPSCMAAVAVEYREVYPENLVAEEISPGFLYNVTVINWLKLK